jgi:O-antigen/teichoic acid export membrane protein
MPSPEIVPHDYSHGVASGMVLPLRHSAFLVMLPLHQVKSLLEGAAATPRFFLATYNGQNRMSDDQRGGSIGQRVLASTLWLAAWRWTARLMGIVSIVILARLLLPEDFGIVATGMVVVAFFDILIDLGTDRYLIRLSEPDREDYDTAWTLRLAVTATASTVIFLAAAPVANFFNDDRLVNVLRVLAVANVMRAFTNIGLIMYQRELQFGKIAMIGLGQRLTGVTTTIVLAFLLQNYWAMVFGQVAFRAAELLLSYLVHPYRPRFATARFTDQWNFSKWIVVRNIATFLQSSGDQLVVAKLLGTELIGLYSMAIRIAQLPTLHLVKPVLLPVYSGLAKKQHEPREFTRGVLQMTAAIFTVVLPAATLFGTLSEPIVISVLGTKWLPVAPLLSILVVAMMAQVLANPVITTLTLLGRVQLLAALHWMSAILGIGVVLIAAQLGDLEAVAQARAAVAIALAFLYYSQIRAALAVSWRRLAECVYRPALASLVMAVVTTSIADAVHRPVIALLLACLVGSAAYVITVYVFWRTASSPNSGEALLVREFAKLLRRMVHRRHN